MIEIVKGYKGLQNKYLAISNFCTLRPKERKTFRAFQNLIIRVCPFGSSRSIKTKAHVANAIANKS